jgi:hypothetical protein
VHLPASVVNWHRRCTRGESGRSARLANPISSIRGEVFICYAKLATRSSRPEWRTCPPSALPCACFRRSLQLDFSDVSRAVRLGFRRRLFQCITPIFATANELDVNVSATDDSKMQSCAGASRCRQVQAGAGRCRQVQVGKRFRKRAIVETRCLVLFCRHSMSTLIPFEARFSYRKNLFRVIVCAERCDVVLSAFCMRLANSCSMLQTFFFPSSEGVASMGYDEANALLCVASFPIFIGGTKRGRKGSCLILILSLAALLPLSRKDETHVDFCQSLSLGYSPHSSLQIRQMRCDNTSRACNSAAPGHVIQTMECLNTDSLNSISNLSLSSQVR